MFKGLAGTSVAPAVFAVRVELQSRGGGFTITEMVYSSLAPSTFDVIFTVYEVVPAEDVIGVNDAFLPETVTAGRGGV